MKKISKPRDHEADGDSEISKSKKTATAEKSAAAQHLGGQPENDEDAAAAGFKSATAGAFAKRRIPGPTKTHHKTDA